ncbi:MAG: hypothetical protein CMF39_04475 [Legionellaceae bacterium]|nr:hypothetical protein [Legionellaceae bacterium]|tara:strand:- start:140 stop:2578 length:2439 start_codon:yes stop_codon:yes gene_type:complete
MDSIKEKVVFFQKVSFPFLCLDAHFRLVVLNHAAQSFLALKEKNCTGLPYSVLVKSSEHLLPNSSELETIMSTQEVKTVEGWEVVPYAEGESRGLMLIYVGNTKSQEKTHADLTGHGESKESKLNQFVAHIMGRSIKKDTTALEYVEEIKNFYESILSHMPGVVYWKNTASMYLGGNRLLAKYSGLNSRKDIYGKTDKDFEWGRQRYKLFRKDDLEVMKTKRQHVAEHIMPIFREDGRQLVFLSTKAPLIDEKNGNVIGILGIATDITDQKYAEEEARKAEKKAKKALEKAEQANRAKSNFLAVMSHELRTPLNAILGLAQILKNGKNVPAKKVHEYGETIQRSGKELLALISDVLEYSRAEAGQLRLEQELVDVTDLVNSVREKLADKAKNKGLSLLVNIDKCFPRNMIADGQRLRQILTNLTDNAIKYSREGTVEIAVQGRRHDDAQKVDVEFFVKDTGIGIPKDQQATIFDEFTQVSSDEAKQYARKHGGVGLGLSIVKRFVDQMGGKIDFESDSHKGTTFCCHFTFPLPVDDRKNLNMFKELSGTTVLFVDDNQSRREFWQRKLLSWGLRVVASNHSHAMQEMSNAYDRGHAFSIVINSCKSESEKLTTLTKQIMSEPRFSDVLHVAVFEERATLSEEALRECGYSIIVEDCHQPDNFAAPFMDAWRKHQAMLASEEEILLTGKRILLVEDNPLNQRVARLLLADLECEIDVADDGESAFKKLNENTYDLVLMDVGLPDISGLTVTEKFRESHPGSDLPIIALTAHALVEDKRRCFDAGMDDYAVKPLDADKLKATIRRWIKRKHVKK